MFAAEIGDGSRLRPCFFVNGESHQDSTKSDLIFDVTEIVYELSQYMVLEPSDTINFCTPQGVAPSDRFPYLAAGDVMQLVIDGLGRQRQTVGKGQS